MIFVLVNLVNQNTDLLSAVKIWKIQEDLTESDILKAFCQSLFLESCITFLKTLKDMIKIMYLQVLYNNIKIAQSTRKFLSKFLK